MDLLKIRQQLRAGKAIFDLPLRVVYYARVSTDTDEQLNSLENQIAYYTEYIQGHKNWTFAGGYVDEGISGTSVKKREDFLRMIDNARHGAFDLIVTKSIARFSRYTLDSIQYTQELLGLGVGVFFQSDNLNTFEPDSELRLTIMSSLAQEEMRKLSENVKFGMRQAYKNGKVLGNSSIYGYSKEGGKLTINESEAAFIRDLFSLYAEDKYGFRTLARRLDEMGYRNQSGGEINPGSLRGILTNPKYKGYYHGRKTESSDYRTQKKIRLAQDEQLLYKDPGIPAIVSEELWDKVNAILTGRSEKFYNEGYGSTARFAYTGKIVCETHGTYHYRKVWKDRKIPAESWCCKEYLAKGRKACETPHLYTQDLESILERIGNDLLTNKKKYAQSIDELIELYRNADKGFADHSREITRMTKEIEKIKRKQDRLLDLYTDGEMGKSVYLEKDKRLKLETDELESAIASLIEQQRKTIDTEHTLEQVKSYLSELSESDSGGLEVAKEMLDKVTVLSGSSSKEIKIKIDMKYQETIPATIIRPTNIKCSTTEISPIVGSEKQSEELVMFLLNDFEESPEKIWNSNIFGKSLHELVNEGLHNKLYRMPSDARMKLQETIERIINEGCSGLVCIIL